MLENAILITGASQRVGLHLAQQFLLQETYPVVITYKTHRPVIDELRAKGALCFQVDFCDAHAFERWLQNLSEQVKSLRAVIHNASIWATDTQVLQFPELFTQMQTLHQSVPWKINHACGALLQNCRDANADIISLTDSSVQMGYGDYSAYLSTKSGLQSMTKSFAKQLAPKVKVNDIAPGLLMFHANDSNEYREMRLNRQLLPIEPGAQVIWQAVQFLMNNPYVTGTSLPVDGGVSLSHK